MVEHPGHELPEKPSPPTGPPKPPDKPVGPIKPPDRPGVGPDHELPDREKPDPKELSPEQAEKAVKASNQRRKDEILRLTNAILVQYNGESNVPVGSNYWTLMNEYRSLM